ECSTRCLVLGDLAAKRFHLLRFSVRSQSHCSVVEASFAQPVDNTRFGNIRASRCCSRFLRAGVREGLRHLQLCTRLAFIASSPGEVLFQTYALALHSRGLNPWFISASGSQNIVTDRAECLFIRCCCVCNSGHLLLQLGYSLATVVEVLPSERQLGLEAGDTF